MLLTVVLLLGIAMAIAVLVDAAASRAREARRASQEAELLSLFAASVLRGADLNTLLERVREAYSQRAVCLVRDVDGHPDRSPGWGRTRAAKSMRRTPPSKSATRNSGC